MSEQKTIKIFPDLRSKIVFSVQTERSELLRNELEEYDGSETIEEVALGLAINLIEDRLKHTKEVDRLRRKLAHHIIQREEVVSILESRMDLCPGCGDELLVEQFDRDQDIVDVYCEKCEFTKALEV